MIFRVPILRVIIIKRCRLILIRSLYLRSGLLMERYKMVLVAGFVIEQVLLVLSVDQSLRILAEHPI